ncbi:MAG: hypothetical protein ABEI99_10170 [Halobaculum sp.]
MNRRTALVTVASLAGVAGCVSRPSTDAQTSSRTQTRAGTDGSPTPTETDESPTPETTVGEQTTAVAFTAYRYGRETDLLGLTEPDRDYFLFVRPPESAPRPPASAFRLALDGRRFSPLTLDNIAWAAMPGLPWGPETLYYERKVPNNASRNGYLVFEVPAGAVERGALVYDRTHYPVPETALSALVGTPEFTVETNVPDVITEPSVTVAVEVSNAGTSDGTFLGGVWIAGYPKPVNIPVPVGETRTATVSFQSFPGGTVTVLTPDGTERFEVALETPSERSDTP